MPRTESLGAYLDALASRAPAPGGGAAAAWTLAQAAALLCMVCRLTEGKARTQGHESALTLVLADAAAVQAAAERLADADGAAFRGYMEALALPKDGPQALAERSKALGNALEEAALVPLAVHELASHLLAARGAVEVLAGIGNARVLSDVTVARCLALAVLDASEANVQVNLQLFKNAERRTFFEARLRRSAESAQAGSAGGNTPGNEALPRPEGSAEVEGLLSGIPRRLFQPAS